MQYKAAFGRLEEALHGLQRTAAKNRQEIHRGLVIRPGATKELVP